MCVVDELKLVGSRGCGNAGAAHKLICVKSFLCCCFFSTAVNEFTLLPHKSSHSHSLIISLSLSLTLCVCILLGLFMVE